MPTVRSGAAACDKPEGDAYSIPAAPAHSPSPIFPASPQEQGVSHFTEHPDALTCTATAATHQQLASPRDLNPLDNPCNLSRRSLTVSLNSAPTKEPVFDIFHLDFFIMLWYTAQDFCTPEISENSSKWGPKKKRTEIIEGRIDK